MAHATTGRPSGGARAWSAALDPMVTHAIRLDEIPDSLRRRKGGEITGKIVARL